MHLKSFLTILILLIYAGGYSQVAKEALSPELLPALPAVSIPTTTRPEGTAYLQVNIGKGKDIVNKSTVPQFANYNKTVHPGESIVMTGANFTIPGVGNNRSQSRFAIGYFNTKNTLVVQPLTSTFIENDKVVLSVDDSIKQGIYVIWAANKNGWGSPVVVNSPQLWWVGPDEAVVEDTVSYHGTNLANNAAEGGSAWLYLKAATNQNKGFWLKAVKSNNYRATFLLHGIPQGEYTTWVQNGLADKLGFSRPAKLVIKNAIRWGTKRFNVKDKQFGAVGDGVSDDQAAIQKCLTEAAKVPFSTIYLPAGTYKVSQGFNPPSNVEWLGDGKNKSQLLLSTTFSYNPSLARQYTLLFNNENTVQCSNARFRNMAFRVMPGTTGQMKSIIYMRGSINVHFEGCLIEAAPGFERLDMSNSRNVFFDNDELVLNGAFFSNASQFFFRNSIYKGILDANVMLEFWGSNGVSVTGCTAVDKDTSPKGQSIGRFFYGSNIWGSNINIYLADNVTQNLAPRNSPEVDQNSGEQYSWEGTNIVYLGKAQFVNSGVLLLKAFNHAANDVVKLNMGVFIVKGRGIGQYNQIKTVNQTSITLLNAWNVTPDTSSVFMISSFTGFCVIYNNTMDGKLNRLNDNIASVGIQLFGNSMNFICEKNLIKEVVFGIGTWAQIGAYKPNSNVQSFCYFNEFRNNTCRNVQTGVRIAAFNWYNEPNLNNELYLGNTFINNVFQDCKNAAIDMSQRQMSPENISVSVFIKNKFISNARNVKVNNSLKPNPGERRMNSLQEFMKIQIPESQAW
jgi:hypothetical protein